MVMNMLKVIIADDEERICQLIQALVDWDALHMEIVGTAANGLEAIELVERFCPDILITDIRMPGCDGLELIQKVKEGNPKLEVIIISGYAHFSYAQTAIKYGVGNYLLKPINKVELTQTLEKLYQKITDRNETESDLKQLMKDNENNKNRVKTNLISRILENENIIDEIKGEINETKIPVKKSDGMEPGNKMSGDLEETINSLNHTYHLHMKQGLFQGFCLKMDYDIASFSESAKKIVAEKAVDMIKGNLKKICFELILSMREQVCYGILNFSAKNQEDVRRVLRDCLNQLTVQKSILGPIDFSIALGNPVKDPREVSQSLKKSMITVQERILTGTGHLLEMLPESVGLQDKNYLERYSRMMLHAVEVLSIEEGNEAVQVLHTAVNGIKNIRGFEIYDLVISAGSLFLMQAECKNRNEELEAFKQNCNQCGTIKSLFQCLSDLQEKIIRGIQGERENDALRPIRLAKQYIQNHYSEQITLEEVSEVVGLSTNYFSVLFKKETGEGFAKYLINIRIEQAKILLRETNDSVANICKSVGYNDLKHFSHTFDKATGLKPGAYRKLYG